MRTKVLIGSGTPWSALLLGGWQAHAWQPGTVVAWGSQLLHAVSPGTRFMAVAAGGVPGGLRGHNLALKSDGTDEVLSKAAALSRSPPHVNRPAAIHRTKLRLLLPVQPLPPS